MTGRTHLVTGAAGQDGALLCRLLTARGETVVATGRSHERPAAVPAGARWHPLDVTDTSAVAALVAETRPDVIHNLAAHSSVAASWSAPEAVDRVNHRAVVGILEVLSGTRRPVRLVQASTAEIFGPVAGGVADERTPLDPRSPYATSKAAAHRAVGAARDSGLPASNLILFGHTGPTQPRSFVIPSICQQAVDAAQGKRAHIELRNPATRRDWGSARDAVRAFVLAVDGPADDYVVATGMLHELSEIAGWAAAAAGVRASVHRVPGDRPADFGEVRGSAVRAADVLGWRPRITLREEVGAMVQAFAAEAGTNNRVRR